ncbi:MAG: hypothetical protein K940chlam5_00360 [Candidatus Anoxychlamydiales bacterium]|nr:hypothetical protein [Candidatus Anoxychlamydiales bacterium]
MSATTKSPAVSLPEAQVRIAILQKRKELLESTNPMKLTDEKVKAFVESNLWWYPVYTSYGQEVNKTLKLENVEIFAVLGKTEANKDMPKFKAWLTGDIQKELGNLADRISADQYHIAQRVK